MSPGSSLVQRAAAHLAGGPAHALEIAHDALGLSGNAGAASRAVFTLLGADRRFWVDDVDVWHLTGPAQVPGPPLPELRFAVVDVETTGGSFAQGHRIIDIAVVEVQGGVVVDEWCTLVNPDRPVPTFVQGLTGIHPWRLMDAPLFQHIAEQLRRRLEGWVLVAHNAAFDWHFVSAQLEEATGCVPDLPRLCALRLARALVPWLRQRHLDAVAAYYGIPTPQRHRARGDAFATARALLCLIDEASRQGIGDLDGLMGRLAQPRRRRCNGAAVRTRDLAAARKASAGPSLFPTKEVL